MCEGIREKIYFETLVDKSRGIKVEILAPTDDDEGKSAPKWLLDRIAKYEDKNGIKADDQVWFVLDIDRWTSEAIYAIYQTCQTQKNHHTAISNPCFEVWLYNHFATAHHSKFETCKQFKQAIHQQISGGYKVATYVKNIEQAYETSKTADANTNHFLPPHLHTKIYQLYEALKPFLR